MIARAIGSSETRTPITPPATYIFPIEVGEHIRHFRLPKNQASPDKQVTNRWPSSLVVLTTSAIASNLVTDCELSLDFVTRLRGFPADRERKPGFRNFAETAALDSDGSTRSIQVPADRPIIRM